MPDHAREPKAIPRDKVLDAEGLRPGYNWGGGIPAPGGASVDFEERVNFRGLHDYRLARAREALPRSRHGAGLCFDNHNNPRLPSTVIVENSRDKRCRFPLPPGY